MMSRGLSHPSSRKASHLIRTGCGWLTGLLLLALLLAPVSAAESAAPAVKAPPATAAQKSPAAKPATAPAAGSNVKPAAEKPLEERIDYAAVMLQDKKIGYSISTRQVFADRVVSSEKSSMTMGRGLVEITIETLSSYTETRDGQPLGFEYRLDGAGMKNHTLGTVKDGKLTVTRLTGTIKETETVDYPTGALMTEGQHLFTVKQGLKAGTKYQMKAFMAESLAGVTEDIVIGPKEKINLLGRVTEAVRVDTVLHTPQADIVMLVYVDDEANALLAETNAMGMKISVIQCDQKFALSPAESVDDFMADTFLKAPGPVPDVEKLVYTLQPKAGQKPKIPETDAQKVAVADDGVITVTVTRQLLKSGQTLPYDGSDAGALAALKPARYVQSADPLIVKAAREAIGETKDAAAAAHKLAAWVHEKVQAKNLSVGYASASEVLRSLEGDCTEHAVLLSAMCRAVGIPSRIGGGMMFAEEFMGQRNIFGGHEWSQVFIGGKWCDLDATLAAPHTNARRLTLVTGLGDEQDWLAAINNFGLFNLTKVEAGK